MRLSERHRPQTLSEIVGQPAARLLAAFTSEPYATCWLLQGSPGTGKTTAALALAHELGCDEGGDLDVICASELSVDSVREVLRSFTYRPMFGTWRVWVIEELETLHPQAQTLLKRGLETLPLHVVVVATSNDTTKLQPALVQRFCSLIFECRDSFAKAGNLRLAEIAARTYPGVALPKGWERWGYDHAEEGRYSLRVSLDRLQQWGLKHTVAEFIDKDDADFIVLACNAHATLVAAVELSLSIFDLTKPRPTQKALQKLEAALKAALAKAKEPPCPTTPI